MSDDWTIVRTLGTEEEAALIAGFLESHGVPVVIDSRLFHQEPVNFGQLGRVEVKVPTEHLEPALELLDKGAAPLADASEDE